MRKSFLIVPFLLLACADEPVRVHVAPGGYECNFPVGAYTATYTKLDGICGIFETESFSQEDERSWFPLALDQDDCQQDVTCDDMTGILHGSSFCTRTRNGRSGTLDATLTFDTRTNTGSLQLEIVVDDVHRPALCDSNYDVAYTQQPIDVVYSSAQ